MQLHAQQQARATQEQQARQDLMLKINEARERIRQGQFNQQLQTFNAAQGSVAPTMPTQNPSVTPAAIPDSGEFQGLPGTPQGGGTSQTPMPLPSMPVGDQQLTPMSAQQQSQLALERVYGQERARGMVEQEFAQPQSPPDYTLGNTRFSGKTNQQMATAPTEPPKPVALTPQSITVDGKGPVAALRDPQGNYFDANTKEPIKGKIGVYERPQTAQLSALPPATATQVGAVSRAFDSNPLVQAFVETQNRVSTIKTILSGQRSGPSDLVQIFEFMKGIDPQSVVRESEAAAAQNSGNIFAGAYAKFNGYLKPNGGTLPESVRQEFMRLLNAKLAASRKQVDNLRQESGRKIDKWTGQKDGLDYLVDYSRGALDTETTTPNPYR